MKLLIACNTIDLKYGQVAPTWWQLFKALHKLGNNVMEQDIDVQIYATSSVRPFELASMGCFVVSDPYSGLEEWFEAGKEMLIARNAEEAVETHKCSWHRRN